MVLGGHGDQQGLLNHAGDIAESSSRPRHSSSAYEMEALSSGDIGNSTLSYPPSYQSLVDEEDVERHGHFRGGSLGKNASSIRTRPSSFQSAAPSVQNVYQRFMRFILRSGTYASHLSYEPANYKLPDGTSSYSGWRGGILAACAAAGTVLILNLIFSIYVATTSKSGMHIGNLYVGDCDTVARADSALHIVINVMGTCLMGASNYTMQCISSPTRREIDEAHCKGKYLDIGLPSIRNLKGRKKKILFWLLVVSTLPIHFLWNSAVFTTTQEVDYNVNVVTPEFLSSSAVDCSQSASFSYRSEYPSAVGDQYYNTPLFWNISEFRYGNMTFAYNVTLDWYQATACNTTKELHTNATQNKLTKLSTTDCINTYGVSSTRLSNWGHVLVVTKEQPKNSNGTILIQFNYQSYISNYTGKNWVCDPAYLIKNNYHCRPKDIATSGSWTLGKFHEDPGNVYAIAATDSYEIDYCLAQKTDIGGKCQLQSSLVIMICVLVANLMKLVCIFWVIKTSHEPVLATIGDGISSFLERPDPITAERPFLSRNEGRIFKPLSTRLAKKWTIKQTKHRWWKGPSKARWFITIALCIIAIVTVIGLLETGNENVAISVDNPYSLGFGIYNEIAVLTIFPWSDNGGVPDGAFDSNTFLIQMVAVANIPQVIVSSLYFAHNTVYTSMVSSDEFSRFTTHRKALRTTNPIGEQRSTYWLSLPWTYSLPLALSSMAIHYLISQSLFVVRTEVLSPKGEVEPISYMQVGYSPLAILLALLFGSGMVAAMILNGFRKLKPCILVGNNSLAIAAACQRPEGDEEAYLKKVQWGVVRRPENGVPGHCTFTSQDVEEPEVGKLYI